MAKTSVREPVPSVPAETPIAARAETGPPASPAPVADQESAGMASEPVSGQGEAAGGRKGERLSAIEAQLAERWPALFGPGATVRPFKIGIHLDILAAMPDVDPKALKTTLGGYCGRSAYVNALLDVGPRYGLDGEPCGEVTEAQIEAVKQQRRQKMKRLERRRAEQEAGARKSAVSAAL